MEIQQAIELLKELTLPYRDHDHGEMIEQARKIAISALERQRKHCGECETEPRAELVQIANHQNLFVR